MHPRFRVYEIRLASRSAFSEAFALLIESDRVASCSAEPEGFRIRFQAPPAPADALVQQVYERAGLLWCSRHDIAAGTAAEDPPAPRASAAAAHRGWYRS